MDRKLNVSFLSIFIRIGKVQFIRSQKKNAQLVYDGFIFNKKLTQANGHTTWRCSDVSKNRCRAVCTTKNNELVHVRRSHDHQPHWGRIANRQLYNDEDEVDEYFELKPEEEYEHEFVKVTKISDPLTGLEFKYLMSESP